MNELYSGILNEMESYIRFYNNILYNNKDFDLLEQMTLRNIYLYGRCSVTSLSRLTLLKPSHLSGVLRSLVKKNMLKKIQSDFDRRIYYMDFTDNGLTFITEYISNYRTKLNNLLLGLTNTQIDELKLNLQKSIEILGLYIVKNALNKLDYNFFLDKAGEDMLLLLDKRTKCSNIIFWHLPYTSELPFYKQNFNHYQYNIMFYLFNNTFSVSQLSRELGTKLKYTSFLIKGLCAKGFIKKSKSKLDKRTVLISLSDQAKQLTSSQLNSEIGEIATRLGKQFDLSTIGLLYQSLKQSNNLLKQLNLGENL